MKKILSVIACWMLSCITILPCYAATDVVVYALEDYPPYTYMDGRELKGIYVSILKQAFSKMSEYRVQMVPIPWKRGLFYLESGDGFALFPPYYLPKERPYIEPYSSMLLKEEVIVICHPDILATGPRSNWPSDYYGLTIGNNDGYHIGGDKFEIAIKENKLKMEEAKTTRQNLEKLLQKRIDCYLNDRLNIDWEINHLRRDALKNGQAAPAKMAEAVIVTSFFAHIGFTKMDHGKFWFKDDFIKQFNLVLEKMRSDGEVQRITDAFIK